MKRTKSFSRRSPRRLKVLHDLCRAARGGGTLGTTDRRFIYLDSTQRNRLLDLLEVERHTHRANMARMLLQAPPGARTKAVALKEAMHRDHSKAIL